MNRPVWIAWGYGFTSVLVGVLLIRGTLPRVGVGGAATEAGALGRAMARGFGGANPESEAEVGPTGLTWRVPESAQTTERLEGAGSARIQKGPGDGPRWVPKGADPLPRKGSDLMRLEDPVIQATADVLWETGVPEYVLEGALRGVYGHVQRLAGFRQMAVRDVERAEELERTLARQDGPPDGPRPSLRWRAEIWPRRSKEYVSYVRRDLELRLGITETAVLDRLMSLADQIVAREAEWARSGESPRP